MAIIIYNIPIEQMNNFLFILLSYQCTILYSFVPSGGIGIGKLEKSEALQALLPGIPTQNNGSANAFGIPKVDVDFSTTFLGLVAVGSFGAAVFQYSHPNDILFKGKEDYFLGLSVLITIWCQMVIDKKELRDKIAADKKEVKDQMAADKKEMRDQMAIYRNQTASDTKEIKNQMMIEKQEMRYISLLTLVISVFALGMKSDGNGIFEKMLVDKFPGIFS